MYLIGAIWDSLTQLLLHLKKEKHATKSVTTSVPTEPEFQSTKRFEQHDSTKEESDYSPPFSPKEISAYILN